MNALQTMERSFCVTDAELAQLIRQVICNTPLNARQITNKLASEGLSTTKQDVNRVLYYTLKEDRRMTATSATPPIWSWIYLTPSEPGDGSSTKQDVNRAPYHTLEEDGRTTATGMALPIRSRMYFTSFEPGNGSSIVAGVEIELDAKRPRKGKNGMAKRAKTMVARWSPGPALATKIAYDLVKENYDATELEVDLVLCRALAKQDSQRTNTLSLLVADWSEPIVWCICTEEEASLFRTAPDPLQQLKNLCSRFDVQIPLQTLLHNNALEDQRAHSKGRRARPIPISEAEILVITRATSLRDRLAVRAKGSLRLRVRGRSATTSPRARRVAKAR